MDVSMKDRKGDTEMFVLHDESMRFPIKVWLESEDRLEESCLEQARHLARLPFIHKWYA